MNNESRAAYSRARRVLPSRAPQTSLAHGRNVGASRYAAAGYERPEAGCVSIAAVEERPSASGNQRGRADRERETPQPTGHTHKETL